MRQLMIDLFLFDSSRRSAARVALWLAVLCVYAGWRNAAVLRQPVPFGTDGHAIASFTQAINEAFCGEWARVSSRYEVGAHIATHPELAPVPIRRVIEQTAGSVPAYCATLTASFGNNENALTDIEKATLLMAPSASVVTVGSVLQAVRIGALLLFSAAVLAAGGSVLMSVAVLEAGFGVLAQMRPSAFTVYPFILVMPLISIALGVLLLRRARASWEPIDLGLLAALGIAAAFGVNIRTSHLPVYVALLALFFMLAGFRGVTARQIATGTLVVLAAFAIAHWRIAVKREPAGNTYNHSYHTVAHPLVLSLAIPDNRFSRREKIQWLDESGIELARTMDPSATYLGPTYDHALYRYYWSLWRAHPTEMLALYAHKLNVTGHRVADRMSLVLGPVGVFLLPWTFFTDGATKLWALLAILLVGVLEYRRRQTLFAALVAAATATAILLHLEAAIIMSSFTLMYHNYAVFYYAFTGIVAAQIAVNGAVWVARRARVRVHDRAAAGVVERRTRDLADAR